MTFIFKLKKAIRCFKKETPYKLATSRDGLFTQSITELRDTLERLEHQRPKDYMYRNEVISQIERATSSQSPQ